MRKLIGIGLLSFLLIACKKENNLFNGYVDAELVYLSADFAGRLVDLPVLKGQLVKPNQFLFRLEQTSERYGVEVSELNSQDLMAQREQILAQLHYNEINYRRILGMSQQHVASQNDLDMAVRDLDVAKQQLADIDVKIKSSKITTADRTWQVSRKENFAPQPGIIFDTYYLHGEFVQAGSPVLSLITKNNIKAIFFVPEKRLASLRLNQPVKIMTSKNKDFAQGHIFYISNIAEYTPPIIYSREERQRLVFRVEARIDSPDFEQIHLGQPVTLEIV